MSFTLKNIALPAGVGVAVVVFWLGYGFYLFSGAEERVRKACSELAVGTPASDLPAFSEKHGLNKPPSSAQDTAQVYLMETRIAGHWGCEVTLEKGMVKSVEYAFRD